MLLKLASLPSYQDTKNQEKEAHYYKENANDVDGSDGEA
jgi:hypothetical protein